MASQLLHLLQELKGHSRDDPDTTKTKQLLIGEAPSKIVECVDSTDVNDVPREFLPRLVNPANSTPSVAGRMLDTLVGVGSQGIVFSVSKRANPRKRDRASAGEPTGKNNMGGDGMLSSAVATAAAAPTTAATTTVGGDKTAALMRPAPSPPLRVSTLFTSPDRVCKVRMLTYTAPNGEQSTRVASVECTELLGGWLANQLAAHAPGFLHTRGSLPLRCAHVREALIASPIAKKSCTVAAAAAIQAAPNTWVTGLEIERVTTPALASDRPQTVPLLRVMFQMLMASNRMLQVGVAHGDLHMENCKERATGESVFTYMCAADDSVTLRVDGREAVVIDFDLLVPSLIPGEGSDVIDLHTNSASVKRGDNNLSMHIGCYGCGVAWRDLVRVINWAMFAPDTRRWAEAVLDRCIREISAIGDISFTSPTWDTDIKNVISIDGVAYRSGINVQSVRARREIIRWAFSKTTFDAYSLPWDKVFAVNSNRFQKFRNVGVLTPETVQTVVNGINKQIAFWSHQMDRNINAAFFGCDVGSQ